jgi:hypothetical protein
MVANHTKKWVDALPDIVYAYNRSKHSYHANTPKSIAKNPFKQLIQRIKTIQSNLNLKAKKGFVLNRIREGSKVRLARKTDKAFSKRIQKYSKRRFTVEGITKNRTMVKLAGVDRHVRPWEILVADETETNPHRRVITSPDVETALEKGRKARSEGRVSKRMIRKEPVLKDAKKNKAVNQSMVGKWLETEDGFQGTVVRATKTGFWLEVISNGKRSDMLVRDGEPYTVLTSPPKATNDDDDDDKPPVSTARTAMVGQTYELNSKRFSVVKVDTKKIHLVDENGKEFNIIVDDDDDAPKQLRLTLFAKTFDWKRHAIPIRTHEEGEPYFLGKALGKARHATAWDSSKSGGEIDEGWLVIPIQWYELVSGKTGVYYLSKNKHLLNLSHTLLCPNSIELVPDGKKTKPTYTVKADDHDMLLRYIAAEKSAHSSSSKLR